MPGEVFSPDKASIESALEEGYEALYMMVMDAIPISVLILDSKQRVLSANNNFISNSRLSRGSTLGRPFVDIFPEVIIRQAKLEEQICSVLQTSTPIRGKRLSFRAPGVSERIYYYSLLPALAHTGQRCVILLMEDVTQQIRLGEEVRGAERHLACVVESASDLVISTDSQQRILSWNFMAQSTTGKSLQDIKGQPFRDFLRPVYISEWAKTVQRLLSEEQTVQVEMGLKSMEEGEVPVSWACSPMKGTMGEMKGIVLVGRNLSEQRKIETQVLQAQRLAALGIMAAGIAHEVRNPLAIAHSACQFLQEEEMESDFATECVSKILKGIQRASTIIDNLLQFARPTAPETTFEPVDLIEVVREVIQVLAHEARIKNIDLRVDLPEQPVVISGRAMILQQVVMNIMLNGIKAMPQGGLLEISLLRERSQAVLRIRDAGEGIPSDDLYRVFDPFFSTRKPSDGTGLGLSLCYTAIKAHLGSIEVESQPDAGTTFIVRVPTT